MFPESTSRTAQTIFTTISESISERTSNVELRQRRELGHAEDVDNWIRKLSPNASAELRMAGWLHDCERLIYFDGTTGFKGDRNTQAYLDHKKDHARRSAELAKMKLEENNWQGDTDRVCFLILHHDDTGEEIEQLGDDELVILAAADSFSFFTYIAPDMLQREGEPRLQDKANFMVGKMTPRIRTTLSEQRIVDPVISRVKDLALANHS